MPLTFPTIAEQVLTEFNSATKTTSIPVLACKRNAEVIRDWTRTVYTFDDDTSLVVTGRGKQHRVEALLP